MGRRLARRPQDRGNNVTCRHPSRHKCRGQTVAQRGMGKVRHCAEEGLARAIFCPLPVNGYPPGTPASGSNRAGYQCAHSHPYFNNDRATGGIAREVPVGSGSRQRPDAPGCCPGHANTPDLWSHRSTTLRGMGQCTKACTCHFHLSLPGLPNYSLRTTTLSASRVELPPLRTPRP